MLDHLSPQRRRFVAVLAVLVTLAVTAVVVSALVRRNGGQVVPVSQADPGPVLLVSGYGGSTAGLDVLAEAVRRSGRTVVVVPPVGGGTGDLRDQAAALDDAVRTALTDTAATSVDLVGYSAGGVVVRLWVAAYDGGSLARRVVTLASPHHGTDLAALAGDLAPDACPQACQQLAPDSDLLRGLNADDETPSGPLWAALWTSDDATVVPASSGELAGAVSFSVQSVCPDVTVGHADVPRDPTIIAMTLLQLGLAAPAVPGPEVCARS
ncbi:alpha/beta fold hydrolase [Nocardioides sp.]|uniref:esterase/lipase family protein n=1 Tax=Nocardioides sp. TaxID=35761 RepID=UPI00286BBD6C|nr:alpha/beta fold hydrolase [Nocardioides sp.]